MSVSDLADDLALHVCAKQHEQISKLRADVERLMSENSRHTAVIGSLRQEVADLKNERDGRSIYELRLEDRVKDLTAVLDAAREMAVKLRRHAIKPDAGDYEQGTAMAASEILRVLGGEVKL